MLQGHGINNGRGDVLSYDVFNTHWDERDGNVLAPFSDDASFLTYFIFLSLSTPQVR